MLSVTFDKARALAFVAQLERGESLTPAGEQWTRQEMLLATGACFLALMSHGPESLRGTDPLTIPLEHREAYLRTLADDLALAVKWTAEMQRLAMHGEYEQFFEAVHQVQVDGSRPAVIPVSGVKQELFAK